MRYMSELMNIENQIVNEELEEVAGGHGSRLNKMHPIWDVSSNKDRLIKTPRMSPKKAERRTHGK